MASDEMTARIAQHVLNISRSDSLTQGEANVLIAGAKRIESLLAEVQQLREERDRYAAVIDKALQQTGKDTWLDEVAAMRNILASVDSGSALAEVKARATEDAAQPFMDRLPNGTPNGRAYNSYTVASMLRERAEQIRKEGQSNG